LRGHHTARHAALCRAQPHPRKGAPPIAKRWTGHESDAVFERYNIIDNDDMQLAAELLQQYHAHARG
jgi:hypothetical protein